MSYTMLLDAMRIAADAHDGQKYGDRAYIGHCLDVAEEVANYGITHVCVALLHDVLEDHPEFLDVVQSSMPPMVYNTLDVLTRRKGEFYFTYILRIIHSSILIAKRIKQADLECNLKCLPPTSGLRNRYHVALEMIKNADKT